MSSSEKKGKKGGKHGRGSRSVSEKRKPSGSPTDSLPPKTSKPLVQSTFSGPFGTSSPIPRSRSTKVTSPPVSPDNQGATNNVTTSQDSSVPDTVFNFINEASMDVLTSKLTRALMLPELQDKFQEGFASVARWVMIGIINEVVAPLRREISDLKRQLETRTDELEQYSRRNFIRISGVPDTSDENTEDVVMDILKEVHPKVSLSDFDRCHRVGRKSQCKKRQLIVKFVCYWDRNKAIANRRKLRNLSDSVYIKEDLTQYRSKLFKRTRDLRSQRKIESTWTYDGRVHIRELSDGGKEGFVKVTMCDSDLDKYV